MPVKTHQSAALERKKFFADPLMVFTILLLIVLLMLFILYPLAMLLLDSVYVQDTALVPLESVLSDALFKLAGELSLEAISRKAARREKKAPDFG